MESIENLKIISWQAKDLNDCGAKCLKIIASHYGKEYQLQYLRNISETKSDGASLYGLSKAANKIGFFNVAVSINFEKLEETNPAPFIAFLNKKHYVVVNNMHDGYIYISDPTLGEIVYSKDDFLQKWIVEIDNLETKLEKGIALLLEPIN